MSMRCELRRSGLTGIYEYDGDFPSAISFSESWNGEVIDFVIERDKEKERFFLSIDEAHAIAVILKATGFIDEDAVVEEAQRARQRMKDTERTIRSIQESAGLTDED